MVRFAIGAVIVAVAFVVGAVVMLVSGAGEPAPPMAEVTRSAGWMFCTGLGEGAATEGSLCMTSAEECVAFAHLVSPEHGREPRFWCRPQSVVFCVGKKGAGACYSTARACLGKAREGSTCAKVTLVRPLD